MPLGTVTTPESPATIPRKHLLKRGREFVSRYLESSVFRSGIGLADQAIVSGSRFVATILLGRVCGADQLGQYGLGFTVIVLIACIQNSLVTLPYTVFAPGKQRRRSGFYAGSVFLQYVTLAVLASLLVGACSMTRVAMLGGSELVEVFAAIAVVAPAILLWEYSRRFGFASLNAGRVLILDCGAAIAFIGGLLGLAMFERLSAANAYLAMGAAYGLVSGIWLLRRKRRFRFSLSLARRELRPHWQFGRWVFASETALMARSYVVPWMVAAWMDETATGIFVAYATIVVLANPVLIGLSNVLAPDLAFTFASEGVIGVRRFVFRTTSVVSAGMLAFAVMLTVVGERLITTAYGSDFGGYQMCVAILSLGILAEAIGMPSYTGLWSIGRPHLCFVACLAGLAITVGLTAALTSRFGITGAAVGYTSGKILSALLQIIAFMRVTRPVIQGVNG